VVLMIMTHSSVEDMISILRSFGDKENVEGMKKFGIVSRAEVLGIQKPILRKLAKQISVDHGLAVKLWRTNIHEARILATLIADPKRMDDKLLEECVASVDNWGLCDQLVLNLLWRVDNAFEKAVRWCSRSEEFVRRTGYALLARLVWKDKIGKKELESIAPLIISGARDERPHVYKAVAWLLKWMAKKRDLRDLTMQILSEITALETRGSKFIIREVKKFIR